MKTVLVVDDNIANLRVTAKVLMDEYKVVILSTGKQALNYLSRNQPDLILLDIMMPDMDGFETMRKIKEIDAAKSIPVIFLTGRTDPSSEEEGLKLGAVDFIAKEPFVPSKVIARVRTHIELSDYRKRLEEIIQEKTAAVEAIQDALSASLSDVIEVRDGMTGGHSRRVASYTGILLRALMERKMYPDVLDEEYVKNISRSAILHDIGKVGIMDAVLLSKKKFDKDDQKDIEYMHQHTVFGAKVLKRAIDIVSHVSFLDYARDVALSHHERWDGKGYPNGIKGEEIPLPARIVAIADVYDALTSERSYKKAFSHEEAAAIIAKDRGTAFDPTLADVFLEIQGEFKEALENFRKEKKDVEGE